MTEPYYIRDGIRIYVGDCREAVPALPEPVSAVVTDPPYGLGFMGKDWDHEVPGETFWRVFKEAMQPGAHLLSFGGSRTQHRIATAIEDADFEIRDTLMWLYGQGFPKSRNLDGAWHGWGTALKPAYEPIILARKTLAGTVAQNVLTHGTGALNIDACRIESGPDYHDLKVIQGGHHRHDVGLAEKTRHAEFKPAAGRWPANVVLDEAAAVTLDEQSGPLTSGANPTRRKSDKFRAAYGEFQGQPECVAHRGKDIGGASRFFYVAKASRSERNAGLAGMPSKMLRWSAGEQNPSSFQSDGTNKYAENHHPTVKPLALMRWLLTLVTPPGGIVLDPFAGSGSTLVAAAQLGIPAVGIELSEEYAEIAACRVDAVLSTPHQVEMAVATCPST